MQRLDICNRFIGIMVGGCVGDTLGSVNENLTREEIIKKEEKKVEQKVYNYTDDTELTFVIAEYLIKHFYKDEKVYINIIHEMFRNTVHHSPRSYSSLTRTILSTWTPASRLGDADTNGSVMRIAPLAFVEARNDIELCEYIKYALYATHGGSKDSIDVCYLHIQLLRSLIRHPNQTGEEFYRLSLSTTAKIKNDALYPLLQLIQNRSLLKGNATRNIFGYNMFQIKAVSCYACALLCFLHNFNNPQNALNMAITFGGDTDTIAKLVGELNGAKHGYSWIPSEWKNIEGFEKAKEYGKTLFDLYVQKYVDKV